MGHIITNSHRCEDTTDTEERTAEKRTAPESEAHVKAETDTAESAL